MAPRRRAAPASGRTGRSGMRARRLVPLGAALCTAAALSLAVPQVAAADSPQCSHVSSVSRPTLTFGDTGAAVKQAQCLSNAWGGEPPKLIVDGSSTRSC